MGDISTAHGGDLGTAGLGNIMNCANRRATAVTVGLGIQHFAGRIGSIPLNCGVLPATRKKKRVLNITSRLE